MGPPEATSTPGAPSPGDSLAQAGLVIGLALTEEGSGAEDKGEETSGISTSGVRVPPTARYRIACALLDTAWAAVP